METKNPQCYKPALEAALDQKIRPLSSASHRFGGANGKPVAPEVLTSTIENLKKQ